MGMRILNRYGLLLVKYRLGVLVAVVAMTIFLITRIGSLKLDMDPDIWAPQSHPYVKATQVLERVFGGRNIVIVGIAPREGDIYRADVLAKVQRIQRGIEQLPRAIRHNVVSVAARKAKAIAGNADGMEVKPLLDVLPQSEKDVERLKAAVAANPIYINALVAADGSMAAVVADFKMGGDASYARLQEDIERIVARERDASVTIHLGGLPIDLAAIENQTAKMPIYFGLALLLMMAIQYWAFRSVQGMLVPIVTALTSVVWGLGFMGWVGVHMDVMNATTPILIMAMAGGHSIQILKRYYEEYARLEPEGLPPPERNRAAVVASLAGIAPVMIVAGIIAALTFLSLLTADISVVRHFGIFAAAGVLSALVLELTLIPALRSYLTPPKRRSMQSHTVFDGIVAAIARQLGRNNGRAILTVSVLLLAVIIAGGASINVDNSLKRYHAADDPVRRDDVALNDRLGGTNSIFFLVEGQSQDRLKDPDVLIAMQRLQRFLEQDPQVGKTQSLADLVTRMNQAMHADAPAYRTIPDSRNLIAQYLFLYSASGDPQDFDNFIDSGYKRAAIWVYFKNDSTAAAEALYKKAAPFIAKTFPADVKVSMGGSLPQSIAINETLTREKIVNMAQMAVVVFLLASLVFRSFVGGVFVVIPLTLIVLANFGLMGWFGIPLDMGTASTASMAIGVGVDYEIYLLFRLREELRRSNDLVAATQASLMTSGKAVLFVALSVGVGYAALTLSDFAFYDRLALTVIGTMAISALSSLVVLRSVVLMTKPKFVFPKSSTPASPTTSTPIAPGVSTCNIR